MGEYLPPIDVYKLGNLYFVIDGHHRVSVARAQGAREIEAHVTEIETVLDTEGIGGRRDLEGKNWGLRFLKRVPLTGERRAAINCTDPHDYHRLAEMIEAWACRLMHQEEAYFDKQTMARRWFDEEYTPVLEMIEEAGVRGRDETGADAYIRVAGERYRLIREHDWNRDVMQLVAESTRRRRPSAGGSVTADRARADRAQALTPRCLARGQVRPGLDVEDVHLRGVHPQLGLRARPHVGGRVEPCRHLGALADHVLTGVLGQVVEVAGVRRAADGEVGVDVGAHRLHQVDRHRELGAGCVADQGGVLEVLGTEADDDLLALALLHGPADAVGHRDGAEAAVERVALDGRRDEVHRRDCR